MGVNPRAPHVMALPARFCPSFLLFFDDGGLVSLGSSWTPSASSARQRAGTSPPRSAACAMLEAAARPYALRWNPRASFHHGRARWLLAASKKLFLLKVFRAYLLS